MQTTARLPDALGIEAQTYARSVGISLNALLLVALRDYLDARRAMPPSGEPSPDHPARSVTSPSIRPSFDLAEGSASAAERPLQAASVKAPKNPRAPCPCGSKQQWRHCHGRAG